MSWPLAFALAAGAIALAVTISLVNIYRPPEPESPQVVCIKQHGQWVGGYGRSGWSGTCDFSVKQADK